MNIVAAIRSAIERGKLVALATSKRARRIRTADEFSVPELTPTMRSPIVPAGSWSWSLQEIMAARDAQMMGQFTAPVELAKSMRTNSALYTAWANRLAPQRRLSVTIKPGRGPKASLAQKEGEALFGNDGIALHPDTMSDVVSDLADHGLAIGVNQWTPRPDGCRVDVELKVWPLRYVWYSPAARCLMTRVDPYPMIDPSGFGANLLPRDAYGNPKTGGSTIVPIVHGDGRWTVFAKHAEMPWQKDAAVLPGAMVYGAIAYAERDWAKGSTSHGSAKVVGEMPEGFDLNTSGPEVRAFMALLADIAVGENPYGIKPFGSKVEILANPSNMWAVFKEWVENREKVAHRIYCGTDAALGSQGGAPGIDTAALFGVSENITSGDLEAIERGLLTGVSEPHAAINYGSSECASRRVYNVPDSDASQVAKEEREAQAAYCTTLGDLQTKGFVVTQQIADDLAGAFRAKPIQIQLAPAAPQSQPALSVVR
jgi:hypothetical protein